MMKNQYMIWRTLRVILQFCFGVLSVLFPLAALADSTQPISFTPPASDVSVVFLTDIFGVVDGVLSGGGSQIMGSMFSIFNASVLALGGMILIYTTIVATINTAGEGQVLGKNWSSIWIPVRTTLGVSLLFTYPSGYSVLQIFVMWIVVQGVGAADLIWNAALGYLQRGGVIIQPIPSSSEQSSAMISSAPMLQGASAILTGVTCMQALQQQLSLLQSTYQSQASGKTPTGPCASLPSDGNSGTTDQQNMEVLCNDSIPNLLDSVNVMEAQAQAMSQCTTCAVPTSGAVSSNSTISALKSAANAARQKAYSALSKAEQKNQQKIDAKQQQLAGIKAADQAAYDAAYEAVTGEQANATTTNENKTQLMQKTMMNASENPDQRLGQDVWQSMTSQEKDVTRQYLINKGYLTTYSCQSCHSCDDGFWTCCSSETCYKPTKKGLEQADKIANSQLPNLRSDLQKINQQKQALQAQAAAAQSQVQGYIAQNSAKMLNQCIASGACTNCNSGNGSVSSECQNNMGDVTCASDCSASAVVLPMPNLPADSPYAPLNGICGTITWNLMDSTTTASTAGQLGVSKQDAMVMENSRAIAVEQMFTDLSPVGQNMVQNDQTLYTTSAISCGGSSGLCYFNLSAYTPTSPFGIPVAQGNNYSCTGINQSTPCTEWISPQTGFTALLNGTELWGAVADYNSIMAPTLNAENNTSSVASATGFVTNAEAQGWIMAGSYFYNLENVNAEQYQNCTSSSGDTSSCTEMYDTDSGMVQSVNNVSYPIYPPGLSVTLNGSSSFCTNPPPGTTPSSTSGYMLCTWYGAGSSTNSSSIAVYNNQMAGLIQGPTPVPASSLAVVPTYSATSPSIPVNNAPSGNWPQIYSTNGTNELNTTVYGYIGNASNLLPAGQTGATTLPDFAKPPLPTFTSPSWSYNCDSGYGYYSIAGNICMLIGNGILTGLLQWIWNFLVSLLHTILNTLLYVPLSDMSGLFYNTLKTMGSNTSNPIVALATSGANYINSCVNAWITLSLTMAAYGMVPITSGVMTVILIVIAPLIFSWLGMIFAVGVILAYFIPMIPYVLFTFGALGWMMGVIEAMVAAPIVALGVMLPEGHEVFGQGKDALMLILSAFLRPGMMIIGYISSIILATVGIWMINTGFTQFADSYLAYSGIAPSGSSTIASTFAFIFLFFIYVAMCVYLIEEAFELIYRLPDGVLRWIGGGTQDSFGAGTAGKAMGEVKGQVEKGGSSLEKGASQKRSFGEGKDKKGGGKDKKDGVGGDSESGGGDDATLHVDDIK